jgi:response regulator RpfG family c-di-GMP phosphodiesterase
MSAQTNGHTGLRPRLLCVDDEPHVLEGLRDVLCRRFDVRVATSGVDGLELLQREPEAFAVVISDMRMPRMAGAEFLRAARTVAPDATRMLLTGHADLEAAIRAVNGARLFRFLTKPCDAAVDQHRVQTAERELLEQTLRGSVDALAEVLALANPVAFGRGGRVKELAGKLARAVELPNWWEVEVAAMLAHIGAVTLPQPTAEKLYAGAPLTPAEADMVARVPLVTRELLGKIPRLEGVIEILAKYAQPLAPENDPDSSIPVGSRVLRIASDYADLEAEHADADVALGTMRGRGIYDQRLLRAFAGLVGVGLSAPVREVSVGELDVGTMLVEDVRSVGGVLLVARGQRVTDQLIERLMNLTTGFVHEPLRVSEAERRA